MKVLLETEELIKAIKILDKIKGDLTVVTALNASSVNLIKADGSSTLIKSIDSQVVQDGRIAIPKETVNLIKKLQPGEVTLTDTKIETETRTIQFEPTTTYMSTDDFSMWEEAFRTTESELHRMIEVKYAAAQDEVRPMLNGVYFNQNETCALDGFRLSIRKGSYSSDKSFVVNKKTIEVLDSILDTKLDREVVVTVSANLVTFNLPGEVELVGRLLEGTPIKYEQILPREFNVISKIDVKALKDEINFIGSSKPKIVKMKFTEELLELNTLSSLGGLTGILKCSTIFNNSDGEFAIAFNPKYIREALKNYKEDIEFRFNGCASPLIITKDGKNLEMILPVRMS